MDDVSRAFYQQCLWSIVMQSVVRCHMKSVAQRIYLEKLKLRATLVSNSFALTLIMRINRINHSYAFYLSLHCQRQASESEFFCCLMIHVMMTQQTADDDSSGMM